MGKRQRTRARAAGTRKKPNESLKEFEKRLPKKRKTK